MGGSIQRALDRLRDLLENDRFSTGGRLPPERTLAGKLGISRSVLRKALSTLEDEGRIWRHVGRGTFVGTKPQIGQEEFSSVSSVTNPGEIMEARLVLEPKLASMAAVRATMSELAHLETIEIRSREAVNTAAFEHWDGLLHQTIAKATDNSLLISLFVVIHKVRQSDIWGSLKKATLNNEHRKMYLEQHRNLVKALKDRNAPMAEKLMREHLETVRQHLLEVPSSE